LIILTEWIIVTTRHSCALVYITCSILRYCFSQLGLFVCLLVNFSLFLLLVSFRLFEIFAFLFCCVYFDIINLLQQLKFWQCRLFFEYKFTSVELNITNSEEVTLNGGVNNGEVCVTFMSEVKSEYWNL